MAKRVVLIGHPVAHSLSGVLQQACFDALKVDATYEPLDRPLIELPETIAELRGDDYLGANITVPFKERVVPMMDRLTEEAHATGAVDTITREGARLVGHNTDVLGFRPTLDALVGKLKMPRMAVVLGAGGGARAVVYGLITAGLPAGHRLQPAPPSRRGPGPALRPQRGAHGAARDALARVRDRVGAGQDQGARQRQLGRTRPQRDAHPGRAAAARPDGAGPALPAEGDPPAARGEGRGRVQR